MIGMYPVGFFNNNFPLVGIEYLLKNDYDLFLTELDSMTWVNNSLYPNRISRWYAKAPSTEYLARPSGFSTDEVAPYYNSDNVFFDGYIEYGYTPENQLDRLGYVYYGGTTIFCAIVWDSPRSGPVTCLSGDLNLSLDRSPSTGKGRARLSSGTETVYIENAEANTGKRCTCFWYDNGTKTVSMTTNGGAVVSATVSDASISYMIMLAHDNADVGNSQLMVSGLATGTTIPTTGNRQRIEGYFCHKYGLAGSLPADHPYKATAPS